MRKVLQKLWLSLFMAIVATFGLSAQIVLLQDGFESGTLSPNLWSQEPASSAVNWSVVAQYAMGADVIMPKTGSYMAKINADQYNAPVKLVTKSLTLTGIAQPIISFDIINRKFMAGDRDTLKIYYRLSQTANWNLIIGYAENYNYWRSQTIRVKDIVTDWDQLGNLGNVQFAFEWCYANAKGICLDNIYIYGEPQCFTPIGRNAVNITSTSVDLQWVPSDYTDRTYIKVSTVPLNTSAEIENATDLVFNSYVSNMQATVHVDNLQPQTTYYWYVRGDCGGGDISAWTLTATFRTKCAPTSVGQLVDFETNIVEEEYFLTPSLFRECWIRGMIPYGDWQTADNVVPIEYVPVVTAIALANNEANHAVRLKAIYMPTANPANPNPVSNISYIASQEFDVPNLTQYQVTFWVRGGINATAPAINALKVGVMTDASRYQTFQEARTVIVNKTDGWREYIIFFDNITNNGKYVAFMLNSLEFETAEEVYIDNVIVEPKGNCVKPQFLTLLDQHTTASSVQISFSGVNTTYEANLYKLSPYNLNVVPNPNVDAPDVSQTVGNPALITNLDYSQDYIVFIRGNCSDGSKTNWSYPITIKTKQAPAVLPLFENFEDTTRIRWDFINGTPIQQRNIWAVGTPSFSEEGPIPYYSPTRSLYIRPNDANENKYVAGTTKVYAYRMLNLERNKKYEYWFKWHCNGESNNDFLGVRLIPHSDLPAAGTAPQGTWLNLITPETYLFNKSEWQEYYNTIPSFARESGTYDLAFYWQNNQALENQPAPAIDDIVFRELTCPMPINLTITNVTETTALINWTKTGTETSWYLWVVPVGTDTVGVAPIIVEQPPYPPYLLENLEPAETYRIFLVANCGPNDMSKPITEIFETLKPAVPIDYCENFNAPSNNELPYKWYFAQDGQKNYWTVSSYGKAPNADPTPNAGGLHITRAVPPAYTGSNSTYFPQYDYRNTSVSYAYQVFDLEAGALYICEFDWKCKGLANQSTTLASDYARAFLVPYSVNLVGGNNYNITASTINFPAGWRPLKRYNATDNKFFNRASWTNNAASRLSDSIIVQTSGRYKIVFMWQNDAYTGTSLAVTDYAPAMSVDNFCLRKIECPGPINMNVPRASITYNSATLNWVQNPNTTYNLKVYKNTCPSNPDAIDAPVPVIDMTGITPPFLITGLEENTEYCIDLQAVCPNDVLSNWTNLNIHTLCEPICASYRKYTFYQDRIDYYECPDMTTIVASDIDKIWCTGTNGCKYVLPDCFRALQFKSDAAIPAPPESNATNDYLPYISYKTPAATYSSDADGYAIVMSAYYRPDDQIFANSYLVLPRFTTPVREQKVSFKAKWVAETQSGSHPATITANPKKLVVGVLVDLYNPMQINPIDTISLTNAWREYQVLFDGYQGTGQYLVIMADGGGSHNRYKVYLDQLNMGDAPVCQNPSDVVIDNITDNSATINWSSPFSSPQRYEIIVTSNDTVHDPLEALEYPGQIVFHDTVTTTTLLPNGWNINGLLSPASSYCVFVRMICDNDLASDWTTKEDFKTTCVAIDKCEYRFVLHDSGNDGWGGSRLDITYLTSYGTRIDESLTIASGGYAEYVRLFCPGTLLHKYTGSGTAAKKQENTYEIYLQDSLIYEAQTTVGGPNTAAQTFIHNESCYEPCERVKQLVANNITDHTANITWVGSADHYVCRLTKTDTGTEIWSEIQTNNTNYSLTNLSGYTLYTFCVYSVCVENGITFTSKEICITFRTERASVPLPVKSNFSTTAETPNSEWAFGKYGSANNNSRWVMFSALNSTLIPTTADNPNVGALGITNSNPTSTNPANSYSAVTSYAYAYLQVDIEAGKKYAVGFDWKSRGKNKADVMKVFLIPYTQKNIETGNSNNMRDTFNVAPASWIDMFQKTFWQNRTTPMWERADTFFTAPRSGTFNLAFFWKNDDGTGTMGAIKSPPAIIDNLYFGYMYQRTDTAYTCFGNDYDSEDNFWHIRASEIGTPDIPFERTRYVITDSGYLQRNLYLIVERGRMNRISHQMCEGGVYDFYNQQLKTSGVYRHYTYSNTSTVCDSVIELTLNVIPSIQINKQVKYCWWQLPQTVGDVTYYYGYPPGDYDYVERYTSTTTGCDSIISTVITIDICTNIDNAKIRTLTIYPNPTETNGVVYVDAELSAEEKQGLQIDVINTSGQILRTIYPNSYPIRIDGFNSSGIYILQMKTGKNERIYGKLIVQ